MVNLCMTSLCSLAWFGAAVADLGLHDLQYKELPATSVF